MTENEAIKYIRSRICNEKGIQRFCRDNCMYGKEQCAFQMAIKALEEIQRVKEIISSFPLDCGSTAEDIREIYRQLRGFLQIGTIEEFKALKEKSVAKKPIETMMCYKAVWKCPTCSCRLYSGQLHCEECGQAILDDYEDWQ